MNHRLALSWLVGPWCALGVLGFDIVTLLARGAPWPGDAMLTIETGAIALPIIGAMVCGASAVDTARVGHHDEFALLAVARGRWRAYAGVVLWAWLPAAGIHCTTILVAMAVGRSASSSATWWELAFGLLVHVLALGWFAALGSVVGRLLAPMIAGLVGAVMGYLTVFATSSVVDSFNPLSFGGATVPRIGLTYSWKYLALQVAVLLVASLVFVLVSPGKGWSPEWRPALRIGFALLAVVAVFAQVPRVSGLPRVVERPRAPTVCSDHVPRVCTFVEQRRDREAIENGIERMARVATAKGYTALVAREYKVTSRTYQPSPPARSVEIPDGVPTSTKDWAAALTAPTHCPALHAAQPPPDAYFADQGRLIETWTALAEGRRPSMTPSAVQLVMSHFDSCRLG
ncbi:hypothetical protein PZ938_19920 [Luteipulveratus sp. YIM 133132]|uniref:hypothetical protein n=1 Tax=Luteipulveratus flavus TaxID=3031728 RepID=UPI0023B1D490|nr:hypothetical protein [Luteipulveratus sp. YIM 133132]MDE9367890.1 hypothetical protein [Luteipulveratus sp. YIM 133132]